MKLIRDKIPMIMQKANVNFEARIADNDEYKEFFTRLLEHTLFRFKQYSVSSKIMLLFGVYVLNMCV